MRKNVELDSIFYQPFDESESLEIQRIIAEHNIGARKISMIEVKRLVEAIDAGDPLALDALDKAADEFDSDKERNPRVCCAFNQYRKRFKLVRLSNCRALGSACERADLTLCARDDDGRRRRGRSSDINGWLRGMCGKVPCIPKSQDAANHALIERFCELSDGELDSIQVNGIEIVIDASKIY